MRKSWTLRLGAIFMAALLAVPATIAAPQQQGQQQSGQPASQNGGGQTASQPSQQPAQQPPQQSSGQPPTQGGQQPPQQTSEQPASQPAQQDGGQQPAAAAPAQPPQAQGEQPVPQSTDPKVKQGGKQDVDAIGNRNVGHGLNFYSLEHEIALGKQLAQEVERSAKFIDDPVVTEYVNRVGQNLVRNSDAQVPFTIKVIDSDVINAFALPGGFFYVNSGLLLHADEESELAGVMAHEIAHVCARHGTKNATKGEIVQIGAMVASIFIPYSWAGYALYQGMNFMIPLTFLKFSRDAEREADYLGLQYMYKAGYDPNSFVSFFEKVTVQEKKQPGTIPKVFSSHPPTPDRIEAIQKEIATVLPARDQYIVTTSEFDVVKRRLTMINNNIKVKNSGSDKPTLRKRTDEQQKTSKAPGDTTSAGDPNAEDPDRPTLKRRPDQQ